MRLITLSFGDFKGPVCEIQRTVGNVESPPLPCGGWRAKISKNHKYNGLVYRGLCIHTSFVYWFKYELYLYWNLMLYNNNCKQERKKVICFFTNGEEGIWLFVLSGLL